MKILISPPTENLCSYYNCAGLFFKDISNLKQYISKVNGNLYFTYSAKEIDTKLLVKMLNMFPSGDTLRYGTNGMCLDPLNLYLYNKAADTFHKKDVVKTLFESLYIYFSIKKYGNPFKQ